VEKTASGKVIAIHDSMEKPLKGLRLFGKTTQNGTPSPDAPIPMVSAGDGGSIAVKIGTSESDANAQTLTVSTPNGLPAVRVLDGGNYTDENGWQWLCDEVDFEKKLYVQKVGKKIISSVVSAYVNGFNETKYIVNLCTVSDMAAGNWTKGWCDTFKCGDGTKLPDVIRFGANSKEVFVYSDNDNFANDAMANAWIANNPVTILYALETEKTFLLDENQLAAFAALHTYDPGTTLYNDAGSHMEVKYMAKGG
jgi:hypothetical protein